MILPFITPLILALSAGLLALLPLTQPRARQLWLLKLLAVISPLIGFYVGYSRMLPLWWQPFPPPDSSRWLAFVLPVFALLALIRPKCPIWLSSSLQALFGAGFAWLTLTPMQEQNWSPTALLLSVFAFALIQALYSVLLEQTAQKTDSPSLGLSLLALVLGGSGVLYLQASSAVFTLQAWMQAILLIIPIGLLTWRKDLKLQGLFTLPAFLLSGLWLNALLFSSAAKWWPLILLFGFTPWLLKTKLLSQPSKTRRQILVFLLTGAILGILLAVIWLSQPDPSVYWG